MSTRYCSRARPTTALTEVRLPRFLCAPALTRLQRLSGRPRPLVCLTCASRFLTPCRLSVLTCVTRGVHIQDLTLIDENPDALNGLVNLHKNRLVYNVINQLLRCQAQPYNFTPLIQLQGSIKALAPQLLDLNKLYEVSLLREPRQPDGKATDSPSGLQRKNTIVNIAPTLAKLKTELKNTTKDIVQELERNDPK